MYIAKYKRDLDLLSELFNIVIRNCSSNKTIITDVNKPLTGYTNCDKIRNIVAATDSFINPKKKSNQLGFLILKILL
jgi:hypothetical protein